MGVEISIETQYVLWVLGSALGQKFRDFSSRAIWRAGFQDLDFEGESSFADLDFFLGFSFLSLLRTSVCCWQQLLVCCDFGLLILLLFVQISACSVVSFPLQWVTLSFFFLFFPHTFLVFFVLEEVLLILWLWRCFLRPANCGCHQCRGNLVHALNCRWFTRPRRPRLALCLLLLLVSVVLLQHS